jgi:quinohemoprotein ethanol dehydrogenase
MQSWAKRIARGAMASALALGVAGHHRTAIAAEISASPAFTAGQLSTLPTTDWITNGGTLSNTRYSPLSLINRDNVAGLKAKWRSGMVTGTGAGNSGEAQILTYGDSLFVANGANDVFAMDIDTGKILWSFQGHPAPKAGSPFGKSTRGVAMGDGLIFSAQLDAKLAALDQKTGKVAWSVQVEPWETGYSITSAPLYYNGMVITGVSGGVMGRRCSIKAYDA